MNTFLHFVARYRVIPSIGIVVYLCYIFITAVVAVFAPIRINVFPWNRWFMFAEGSSVVYRVNAVGATVTGEEVIISVDDFSPVVRRWHIAGDRLGDGVRYWLIPDVPLTRAFCSWLLKAYNRRVTVPFTLKTLRIFVAGWHNPPDFTKSPDVTRLYGSCAAGPAE